MGRSKDSAGEGAHINCQLRHVMLLIYVLVLVKNCFGCREQLCLLVRKFFFLWVFWGRGEILALTLLLLLLHINMFITRVLKKNKSNKHPSLELQ